MKKSVLAVVLSFIFLIGCANNMEEGISLLEQKKYEDAITVFQKDVNKGKHLDEAYRGIGMAYYELEEYDKAIDNLQLAIDNGAEKTAVVYGLMGACHMKQEDYEKALGAYKKALKQEDITEKLRQEVCYNMIAIYEYTGDWDAAKKQMEDYVKDYPDDTRVKKEAEFLETR